MNVPLVRMAKKAIAPPFGWQKMKIMLITMDILDTEMSITAYKVQIKRKFHPRTKTIIRCILQERAMEYKLSDEVSFP